MTERPNAMTDAALDAETLARRLWQARAQGGVLPRDAAADLETVETAYAVQRRIAAMIAAPRAGWKVGATSAAAQTLLGTDEPATAPLFQPECVASGAAVGVFPGQHASVESEFAFRFTRDLPRRDAPYGRDEVLDAVGAMMPAIEVVGCRFEGGFDGLGAVRLIADMVANTGWVRGAERADWRDWDLKAHPVSLGRDGETVAEGTGAAALGDPLTVLEWTANHLSRLGEGLEAGEVVSTGTCTGVTAVGPGETLIADFGTLGRVEVRFEIRS